MKTKGETWRKTWRCQACRKGRSSGSQIAAKSKQDTDMASVVSDVNAKLARLMPLVEKVDSLLAIRETVSNIEASVELMSAKYDELLEKTNKHGEKIERLSSRLEKVEASTGSRDTEIRDIRRSVNELEQYSRLQNLEVHGLRQTEGENLFDEVNKIAKSLCLAELSKKDVEGLHRLPSRQDRVPTVLVRFSTRFTRDEWLSKRAALREAKSNIYFQENMTAQTRRLFWLMKSKADEKHYQYAWHKQGKLFVRRRNGEPVIRINNEEDLSKIT